MEQDLERVLLTKEEIDSIVHQMGRQITEDYRRKSLLLLGVLNGGVFLAADLARAIDLPCKMDFVGVSSYGDGAVSGALSMTKELSLPVKDMDVLVVEDVLDTGKTLSHLLDYLKAQGASSVKLCVMLDKAESHVVDIAADYVGAVVGSEFLVGYGLDYGQHYRNLPYIGVLKEAIYR